MRQTKIHTVNKIWNQLLSYKHPVSKLERLAWRDSIWRIDVNPAFAILTSFPLLAEIQEKKTECIKSIADARKVVTLQGKTFFILNIKAHPWKLLFYFYITPTSA